MKALKALLTYFIISLPILVLSQINTIKFEHYSSNEGLSQITVKCIQQDTLGFLWFGTVNGLNRYDGKNFIQYFHEASDSSSLSSSNITKIYEDSQGNLWVGTENGLNLFDRTQDFFQRYTFKKNGSSNEAQNYIQDILEDKHNNLWIATKKGLVLFDYKKPSFQSFYVGDNGTPKSGIAGNNVRRLYQDKQGKLWVGFFGLDGLQYYDPATKQFTSVLYNPEEPEQLLNVSIADILEDSNNNFWLATREKGLLLFDRKTNTYKMFQGQKGMPGSLQSNTIWDLEEDNNGQLLLATEEGGLNIMNLKSSNTQFAAYQIENLNPYSISSNSLLTLHKDKTGLIWIGSFNGINKIDPGIQKFTHYQSHRVAGAGNNLSDQRVFSIIEDQEKNVWVGTHKGLNKINASRDRIEYYHHDYYVERSISSDHVQCLLQDKSKNIWVGTSNGLDVITPEKKYRVKRFSQQKRSLSLSHPSIRCLLEDNKRQLWVGTEKGLNILSRNRAKVRYLFHDENKNTSISNDFIRCLLEDQEGRIWVGTEKGLNRFNSKTGKFERFRTMSGINNELIYCLYEDSNGTIWVGTPSGLNKAVKSGNTITFETFNVKNGFADNTIHAIRGDDEGNLWLSTNKGITKFNPTQPKDNVRNYNYQDGLQSSQFNSNASYNNKEGELFFGGREGLNIFNPIGLASNQTPPKVILTDFKLLNESVPIRPDSKLEKHISVAKEVVLSSDDKVISFEYVALNYTQTHKNSYMYKLDNFDATWQHSSNNSAGYTNLDPGNYTFMVKAANNDGVWNEIPTKLSLVIEPTLLQTWYFKLGALLALLGISYLIFKTRVRQLQRDQIQLEKTVKERTQQLENQKEELEKTLTTLRDTQDQLLTSEKMASLGQLTAGIAHEINNPINFISSNVQALKMDFEDVQNVLQKVKALENHQDLKNGIKELMLVGKQMDVQLLQKEINGLLAGIERGTERTVSIVSSLRTFSRNSNESFRPANIHEGLDSTLTILNSQLNGHIKVIKNYGPLPLVNCQIGRLNQVFLNIINNAIHAIDAHPEGVKFPGEVYISTVLQGNQVIIKVQDNGVGMDPITQKRIFEPFYTTKDVGDGTGLGLSISYGIIEQHKGSIDVESVIGKGTVFNIVLPIG